MRLALRSFLVFVTALLGSLVAIPDASASWGRGSAEAQIGPGGPHREDAPTTPAPEQGAADEDDQSSDDDTDDSGLPASRAPLAASSMIAEPHERRVARGEGGARAAPPTRPPSRRAAG